MLSVLLDNWTIHNSFSYIFSRELSGYTVSPNNELHDDLESFIMSILLWDKIYYWDNENATEWKAFSQNWSIDVPIHPIKIDTSTESLISQETDLDLISGGAKKYQLLANKMDLDYLPQKSREKYLRIHKHNGDISEINWPKYCVNQIDEAVMGYYDSIIGSVCGISLQFEFPLLLDYIIRQSGSSVDSIAYAQELRSTRSLHEMRLWLNDLHTYINRGNWLEVANYIKDVKDIVSAIEKHAKKKTKFSVGVSPTGITPSFDLDLSITPSAISHQFQLTFLRDIAKFGLTSRPSNKPTNQVI